MHDLRRQALESGKTVSRKARSRQVSGASSLVPSAANSRVNSRANSRVASRNASRHPSDDEDGNLSDSTSFSINSIDDVLAIPEDTDASPDAWVPYLEDRITEITDRKRSSIEGREKCLQMYNHVLIAHYTRDEISRRVGELIPALLKSVKMESSEKETVLALKAIALTIVTDPSDSIYDMVYNPLKRTITDSESSAAKAAAIHTLGVATFYGGASEDSTKDTMEFFLEIVESDGNSVEAGDDASVVTAALEEWGFLASQLDDLEDATEPAMDAFIEQLSSADPGVQIAAGENIALLYEKSYTELEEDEEPPETSEFEDPDDEDERNGPIMVKRYTVYRREDQLKHELQALANISGKNISKKDRKNLHVNFADILQTVEKPTLGPRYQKAIDQETNRSYGSRMKVRVSNKGEMRIDKWWKLHRLQALRRVLQGGFVVHYEKNEVVFDTLPIMISTRDY